MNDTIVRYAEVFYLLLDSHATENEYHERIFEGSLTELYKQLGASSAYYSTIRRLLIASGAIEVMQRGTGKQPSQVKLSGHPENISAEGLTDRPKSATLVAEWDRRLTAFEAWRENLGGLDIVKALAQHEKRLTELERKASGKSGTGGKN